jgi:beta-lactam-binding protein with PASTA domain
MTDVRPSSSRPRRNALRLVAIAAALLVTTACQEQTEISTTDTTKGPTGTTNSGRRGIEVPGVLGISLSEARETLERADLPFLVAPRLSDEPQGTVLWQSPREGQRLFPGDLVYLVVADRRPRCYEYAEC